MDVDDAMQYGGAGGARSAVIVRKVADTELEQQCVSFRLSCTAF